ncbi:polyprenyl synthetase family protein [Nonomuraea sp. JJY05]|uniref:polyprenyl synthetase family protein n=1 Tax=Nonomuraea sp. JJY05 TaxID=3350255 RepID=UPI00373F1EBB
MNAPTSNIATPDPSDLLDYYSQVVVPLRAALLESRCNLLADIGGPVEEAARWITSEFPRHRIGERPLLTYLAWLLGGGKPGSLIPAHAAIASELVHEGGLIHDDIVDNSPMRRFQPTQWARYAATHGGQPWAADFGKGVALWLGDLMLLWADDIFGETVLSVAPAEAEAARRVWVGSVTQIWASQHIDLIEAAAGDLDAAQSSARKVISLKGRYVATVPLQLGAALAGAEPALMQALETYGRPLGEAYVLRNDLEGIFGTRTSTDKIANDLRERRLSMLVLIAYNRSNPKQRQLLRRAGSVGLHDDEAAAITSLIEETGARAEVERMIDEMADQTLAAVEAGIIADWARPLLAGAVHKALKPGKYGRS